MRNVREGGGGDTGGVARIRLEIRRRAQEAKRAERDKTRSDTGICNSA
jgi:hypothetical protein